MVLYRPGVDTPENKKYYTTAIDAFKKYLDAFPQDAKAQDFLISTYVNASKYEEVLKYLQDDLKKHPGDDQGPQGHRLHLPPHPEDQGSVRLDRRPHPQRRRRALLPRVACTAGTRRTVIPRSHPQQRGEYVELGLTSADKALQDAARVLRRDDLHQPALPREGQASDRRRSSSRSTSTRPTSGAPRPWRCARSSRSRRRWRSRNRGSHVRE